MRDEKNICSDRGIVAFSWVWGRDSLFFNGIQGNVTLFDWSSPYAGLNNPALLNEYGGYPNPWIFRPESTSYPEWGLCRVYLFSLAPTFGVNTSFYRLLEAYLYYLAYYGDPNTIAGVKEGLDRVAPWTGYAFDTSMLAHPTNDFTYVQKAINIILSNSSPGFYFRFTGGLGAVFFSLRSEGLPVRGVAIQPVLDMEAYGSLTSEQSTFFFIRDPQFRIQMKGGVATSVGLGHYDLPLIGEVDGGLTLGLYPYIAQVQFENLEEILDFQEAMSQESNSTDLSSYDNVRIGKGASLDIGLTKTIQDRWKVALKGENILAPVVWQYRKADGAQHSEFGWLSLPNLVAGFRYTHPVDRAVKFFINEPSLYVEIEDLLYTKPLALLAKVRMGADVKLLLDMVQVGVGLNQGYPTAGGRVNLTLSWLRDLPGFPGWLHLFLWPVSLGNLTVWGAYYGREIGHYPGQNDVMGYQLGVEFFLEFGANGPSRKVVKTEAKKDDGEESSSLASPVFEGEAPPVKR